MKHVMLDLETFGTKPGAVIRSIGAVQFDPRTGIGEEFYRNITEEDQVECGAHKDPNTVTWWKKQSQESQDQLLENQVSLKMAVNSFANYFKENRLQFVWAQGSAFDCSLWEHTCGFVNVEAPWRFWNTRDTRTAYQMTGFNTKSITREGTYHNALDDAKHQVRCVYKCYMLMDGVTKR